MRQVPNPDAPPAALLPIAEAARLTSLSARTIWSLIARGELVPYRFGRRATRVAAADVQRLIESARGRVR